MKEKLRGILTKVLYGVFALFISAALWMFVEITENELQTQVIPVHEIIWKNQALLDSRTLLVASVLTDNLTITFEAPLTEITKLRTGTVDVEVDLESVRSTGNVALSYDVILPEDVNEEAVSIAGQSASQIILTIDRIYEKEFKVEVDYTGGAVSSEYMIDSPIFDPLTIIVRGPEAIVSRIAHVYVPIVAENLYSTYTDERSFILIDEDGEELNGDYLESGTLTFSDDTILVTIPVKLMKTVPLQVELAHGITTSEANTSYTIEPSEITVAGEPDVIRELNSIPLGTIDMTSFALSTTREFQIIPPANVENVSNESKATVIVEVRGLAREYRSVSTFQISNLPAGYSAEVVSQSLDVSIRGTPTNLSLVRPENIWVVVDLTDANPGTSRVVARAFITGVDAEVEVTPNRSGEEYLIAVTVIDENAP